MFDKLSAATLKVDYSLMGERELLERFHLPESEAFKDGSITRRSAPERLGLTFTGTQETHRLHLSLLA